MSDVQLGAGETTGKVAHDSPDAGNPDSTGLNATEFAEAPPEVDTDGDRVRAIATAQGIQYILGGHPNIISREYVATTAQTNDPIIDSVPSGSHVVITAIEAMVDKATTVDVGVRIGFGTTVVPAEPTDGNTTTGVVLSHPGIAAGSGVVRGTGAGVLAVGPSDQELRITNEVPTTGKLRVLVTYYISTL